MGSKSPVLRKTKEQNAAKKCKKKVARFCRLPSKVLAFPIFPASHPASIFGDHELNFCVRDGNRWTLMPINTNSSIFFSLAPLPRALSFVVTRTGFEPMLTA